MTFLPALAPAVQADGVRFRVLSRAPERLHLQLYADARSARPERTVTLERQTHCRDGVWEVVVAGVGPGQPYTWAVEPDRPLLDPYALALSGPTRFGADDPGRARPAWRDGNRDARFKSLVVAPPPPVAEWQRPRRPLADSVLYEVHVRGATRHPSSGCAFPGTFRGLESRIGHLLGLGVTAVELLPVHEFDESEPRHGHGLFNFWGYSPIAWFAPNRRYASEADAPEGPIGEFRRMVLAFHRAGIEVIVDAVFNHTAEMAADGPTWHLRGLDDELYYLRDPRTGAYSDYAACGNTLCVQRPQVRALVLDALRWWVHGLGVDGFRFDLAATLARGEDGAVLERPPLVREIEADPLLEGVHLVAEAWDARDGYLVGRWPGGERWAVWNDRFRDDVRRAWLVEPRYAGALATRLCGSSDLFAVGPLRGVNYVAAHDGFTLADVVSYSRKHNEANGEDGRDGNGAEVCANHGVEGPTRNRLVRAAREKARRNLMASLLLAQGVPMILAGDEIGRTQRGNNNAYCHDDERTWIDWRGLDEDRAFHRFVKGLVALRRSCAALRRRRFLVGGEPDRDGAPDVRWIGPAGEWVDWEQDPGHFGYVLSGAAARTGAAADEPDLLVLVNLHEDGRPYRLPQDRHGGRAWRLVVDTAAAPPADFRDPAGAPPWTGETFPVKSRSLAVFRSDTLGRREWALRLWT